ncbi:MULTISPECIES: hypothetical protein [Mycoplasma]|uniref:Uncharacterized protein n=3 Tax=Mycoplasma TaxID=2093 RepID=A0A6M4JFG9_9MOLU|nr:MULTISPECIES: hypothetical protein [Mycoplasma]MBU4693907.1 hypothetical protein [Mycoplasma zalophidermidis]MCR8966671.1 hypothetical protein [Mycoplasma zalophidermidis]QJR43792.1 hypothetical protein HLA87_03335 [Mycoplasma miroungigenitalium]
MNVKITRRKRIVTTTQETLEKLKRIPKILPRKLLIMDIVFCCIGYSLSYTDEDFESDEIQFQFMMMNYIKQLKMNFGFSDDEIEKAYYKFMIKDKNKKDAK